MGFRKQILLLALMAIAFVGLLISAACGGGGVTVRIDGSSTVFPITEAVAEEFMKLHRNVQVTVGISGTGGGFKRFCAGETDISDASRPISASEIAECAKNGIQFVELPVAYDGLSVVVNPENNWAGSMTMAELKRIWEPSSAINKWNQVRPEWPNEEIVLVGAGTDSGTFDYFTEAVVGRAKASRPDYIASEDDNVLVQAIADSRYALGYFGYSYYVENKDKLKLAAIDDGKGGGPVLPSGGTITDGSYPLSRPLLIYVAASAEQTTGIKELVEYYLSDEGIALAEEVGYIALPQEVYQAVRNRFEQGKAGTVYVESASGKTLEELYVE